MTSCFGKHGVIRPTFKVFYGIICLQRVLALADLGSLEICEEKLPGIFSLMRELMGKETGLQHLEAWIGTN